MPILNWIGKEKIVNHDKDVAFRLLRKNKEYLVFPPHSARLRGLPYVGKEKTAPGSLDLFRARAGRADLSPVSAHYAAKKYGRGEHEEKNLVREIKQPPT